MLTAEKVDPRVLRTRKLLIDAFHSLLAEKPFDEITVQDIAARATVNRATFYAHFLDKYALVDIIVQTSVADTLARWLTGPLETPAVYLERLFLAISEHLTTFEHARCRSSYQALDSLTETQIKQQVCAHVRAWLQEHMHLPSPACQRLDLAGTMLSWALYGAALEWKQTRRQTQPAEEYAREALPLIVAMVDALECQ